MIPFLLLSTLIFVGCLAIDTLFFNKFIKVVDRCIEDVTEDIIEGDFTVLK